VTYDSSSEPLAIGDTQLPLQGLDQDKVGGANRAATSQAGESGNESQPSSETQAESSTTPQHLASEAERIHAADTDLPLADQLPSETADESRQDSTDTTRQTRKAGSRQSRDDTPRPKPITAGDELEYRFARMYFWQGSYARCGINLERHYYPEPLLVTDLDLLAYEVSPQLQLIKTIGEAKSGTGKTAPKPLDRAIWLAGLMRLVQADRASLVTSIVPSTRVRETVRSLGVYAIGLDELARWEKAWLTDALIDCGGHGPTAFQEIDLTRQRCKSEPDLERAYWFLRSEVWFLDEWQATKRLIGVLNRLQAWWTPSIDDAMAGALRWLYAEALSVLTLQLTALVGRSQTIAVSEWPHVVQDRLAEGAVPAHHMRALADSFDKYLGRALREAKADNAILVESMGAFYPVPPTWAESLIELMDRLSRSDAFVDLPRHTDLIMHERLVKRRHASQEALGRASRVGLEVLARDRRQIAAFLRSCVRLPDAVLKAFTT
jgi:hypothetical protein